ncbi:ABC transporter substrate-binding protein [Hyperthermus butylicus]|uniref:Iron III ABC transporter, periplasmic substrate-binding protein n=1 Tax=Hyperthermus butylicus (strain DSM 5456 / JCM 9403 / PLM1-5) TaxID=415426 RepID=A2BJ82_HYPBU|nr:ABC transporter substrate-binding protein [Hyperthermus butylicus]ABM80043.1 putative iron III ABC transporter, periplasmic substrate-binding protein [Hyperthermus butylicus DSM 5456]
MAYRSVALIILLVVAALVAGIAIGYTVGGKNGMAPAQEQPVTQPAGQEPQAGMQGEPQVVEEALRSRVVVLVDALGREVTLARPPERIASLAPSITEVVCALGACDRLVAVDNISMSIVERELGAEAVKLVSVGSFWQPSSELVLSANPDMVLACSGVPAQEAMVGQLEDADIKVFFLRCDRSRNIGDIYWDISTLGVMLNETAKASEIIEEIQARLQSVATAVANETSPTVALVVYMDSNGVYVAGGGNFQDNLIQLAGGVNVFGDYYGWPMISYEDIVVRDPDYIVVTSMGTANDTISLIKSTLLSKTKAYSEGHVCIVTGEAVDVLSRPSVRIADAVELLASILHPDAVEPPSKLAGYITCIGAGG